MTHERRREHRPSAAAFDGGELVLRRKESACQIGFQRFRPTLPADSCRGPHLSKPASIVEGDVQPAKAFQRFFDTSFVKLLNTHVASY